MRTPCRLLALLAIALVSGTVGARANHAIAATAVTCTHPVTLNLITYGYTDALTNYSPAPRCWGYNRLVQNTSTFTVCSRVSSTTYGSGANRVYDDTNPNIPLSTDQSAIQACVSYPFSPPPPNGGLYAEYMGSKSSTCTTGCWREVTAGYPIKTFYAELYAGQDRVANLISNWENYTESGIGPGTVAGTINISPFIYNYGNGLYHDWTALRNWVVRLCNDTPSGNYMSIYGGGGMTVAGTAEQQIIDAMNSCTGY